MEIAPEKSWVQTRWAGLESRVERVLQILQTRTSVSIGRYWFWFRSWNQVNSWFISHSTCIEDFKRACVVSEHPPSTLWIFVGVDSPLHPGAILTLQGRPSQRLSPCQSMLLSCSCEHSPLEAREGERLMSVPEDFFEILQVIPETSSKRCTGFGKKQLSQKGVQNLPWNPNEVPTSFVWLKVQFVVILEHSWLGIHRRQSKQWGFSLCFFPSLHWLHSHRLQQQVLLRPPNVFQICNRIGPCPGGIFHQKIHTQEDGNLHAHMVSFNNSYSSLYRIELYIDSLYI